MTSFRMKEYFTLQYKMTNRRLSELGIHPIVGYSLGIVGFVLLSEFIFLKTEFAKYVVVLMAFSLLIKVSEVYRTEFLTLVFGNKKCRQIRVVENLIISVPFAVLLLCHLAFIETGLLMALSIFLANVSFKGSFNYSLPTPFYKKPFEFAVGFRNTFYIFPVAYTLTVIAMVVGNLNLGVFAMLLIFLVSLTYYTNPENEYFVWSYSISSFKFLAEKLITATLYSALLALPIAITLLAFYSTQFSFILVSLLIGFTFLWTIILAKYSAYPNEMNLPEGILIAISIGFPPFLLFLIPFFYNKAIRKLNTILK